MRHLSIRSRSTQVSAIPAKVDATRTRVDAIRTRVDALSQNTLSRVTRSRLVDTPIARI